MRQFNHALAKQSLNPAGAVLIDTCDSTRFVGLHIGSKELQNGTKFIL
jgi:hypothetical protein